MASYASGGPIIWGQLCEVVRQFFLVVAIEKLMTGDGAWSLGIQARRLKPGLLRRGGCRNGAQKGPERALFFWERRSARVANNPLPPLLLQRVSEHTSTLP